MPSCAPANASVSRSSLSRSAASLRRRSVMSRATSWTSCPAPSSSREPAISTCLSACPVRRVGARDSRLDRRRALPGHPPVHVFAEAGAAVRVYQVEQRPPQQFVRGGCPAEPHGRGVEKGDAEFPADEDGVRRLLDQTPVLLGHHFNLTVPLASTPRTSRRIAETEDIRESEGLEDILWPASRSRLRACSPCRPSSCPA